jgi:pimeloyl-ACP methyl ester carboxylesterase
MLNGMWGDYLHARGNGLAVDMAFYQHGRPLTLDCHALRTAHARPTAKLCVLLHGLGCNELLWQFAPPTEEKKALYTAVDYGRLLHDDLGYTPFYVRYNTGLAVAENGRSLARLLDALYNCYSIPIGEIVLIGHSMGGLVVRSACHYATQHSEPWVQKVKHIHYLGTPHDGADLERLTHRTAKTLQAIPNPIARLIGDGLNLRSRGIKDLRHGTLLEPDVMDEGWDDLAHHHRRAVPWLPHAQHYLVGGTWHGDPEHVVSVLLGDGLVGAPATMGGAIPLQNIRLFPGIRHLQLARNWEVYQQIVTWLKEKE